MMARICDVCGRDCTASGYEVTIVHFYGDQEIRRLATDTQPRHICAEHITAVEAAVGLAVGREP